MRSFHMMVEILFVLLNEQFALLLKNFALKVLFINSVNFLHRHRRVIILFYCKISELLRAVETVILSAKKNIINAVTTQYEP